MIYVWWGGGLENELLDYQIELIVGTLLGDSCISLDKRYNAISYRLVYQHTNREYFDFKVKLLNLEGKISKVKTGYGSLAYKFVSNALTDSNFPINKFYYTGHHNRQGKRKYLKYNTLRKFISLNALALWIADDGSLAYNNRNKNTPILTLHTQNSDNKQVDKYIKLFNNKYKCDVSVYKDKRVKTFGNFLAFNTKDTLYLLNQLRKKQVKGMEYKFYFPTEGYIGEIYYEKF